MQKNVHVITREFFLELRWGGSKRRCIIFALPCYRTSVLLNL